MNNINQNNNQIVLTVNRAQSKSLIEDVFAKFGHLLVKNLQIKWIKLRRKDNNFSKRLNYAIEKISKTYKTMMKRKYKTIDEIADSFHFQGGKT